MKYFYAVLVFIDQLTLGIKWRFILWHYCRTRHPRSEITSVVMRTYGRWKRGPNEGAEVWRRVAAAAGPRRSLGCTSDLWRPTSGQGPGSGAPAEVSREEQHVAGEGQIKGPNREAPLPSTQHLPHQQHSVLQTSRRLKTEEKQFQLWFCNNANKPQLYSPDTKTALPSLPTSVFLIFAQHCFPFLKPLAGLSDLWFPNYLRVTFLYPLRPTA